MRQARGLYLPAVSLDARYSRTSGVLDIGDLVNPAYAALNQLTRSDAFPTDVDARCRWRRRPAAPDAAALRARRARDHRWRAASRAARGRSVPTRSTADGEGPPGLREPVRMVETHRATLPLLDETSRQRAPGRGRQGDLRGRATGRAPSAARRCRSSRRPSGSGTRRPAGSTSCWGGRWTRPCASPRLRPGAAGRGRRWTGRWLAAWRAREELAQGDSAIRAAESQGRLARASYLPGVALAVDYGIQGERYRFGADDDFAVASLVLEWNVFNGGQDAARGQAARLDVERAAPRRAELERAVELEVRQAWEAVASRADRARRRGRPAGGGAAHLRAGVAPLGGGDRTADRVRGRAHRLHRRPR